MKYQSQYGVIDPEVKPQAAGFEFDADDDSDAPDDAYVIGEDGSAVHRLGVRAVRRARTGPKRWAKPAAFLLGALFVGMTAWNLSRLIQGPPPPPKPSPFQVKQALYLGVMKIDAYRRVHGVTPDSLANAGLPEAGAYVYQRMDSERYVLSFRDDGSKIEYDSNESRDGFFGTPKEILTMGGSQ